MRRIPTHRAFWLALVVSGAASAWPANATAADGLAAARATVSEASAETSERAAVIQALRLLGREGTGDDIARVEAALAVTDDEAVEAAALEALARLSSTMRADDSGVGAPEARAAAEAVLAARLAAGDAASRERAALALLRARVEVAPAPDGLDADLDARARLQVVTPEGRAWLDARDVYGAIRALRRDHADVLAALLALGDRTDLRQVCVQEEAAIVGLPLESMQREPERAERYWREGRLDRLTDERLRLEAAADVGAELLAQVEAMCVDTGTSSDPEPAPFALPTPATNPVPGTDLAWAEFLDGSSGTDAFGVRIWGWFGHDNNTFRLNRALRVSEPGPFLGQPIDLRRDDTFGGVRGALGYRSGFGGTVLDRDRLAGFETRGNQFFAGVSGGWDGRLRWAQLGGVEAELDVHWDMWDGDAVARELSRTFVGIRGGLENPDYADEENLTQQPLTRAGAAAALRVTDFAHPPGDEQLPGVRNFELGFDASLWHELEPEPGETTHGIVPVEAWWSTLDADARWLPVEIGPTARFGGLAALALRLSEGAPGHALSGELGIALETAFEPDTWLEVAAGWAVGGGLSDDAQPPALIGGDGRVTPVGDQDRIIHSPMLRGRFVAVDEQGDDFLLHLAIEAARTVEVAGRYGWGAVTDSLAIDFDFGGPAELSYGGVRLYADHASYPEASAVVSATGSIGEAPGEAELVVVGATLRLPLWADDWLAFKLRGDGRLVSDSTRFDGRFTGQVRVLVEAAVAFDLYEAWGDPP